MVLKWLLGINDGDKDKGIGDLDEEWYELGETEQQVWASRDANAYQDLKGKERELQERQHEKDVNDAFNPPKFD